VDGISGYAPCAALTHDTQSDPNLFLNHDHRSPIRRNNNHDHGAMTDEIIFDGKLYVSAHDAARIVGVTGDYIARLAKSGQIPARRLCRNEQATENPAVLHLRI
jgi:hypothetical protein